MAFTSLREEAACELYKAGHKVVTIAEALEYSQVTIYAWLRKHKVMLRTTPNWSKYRRVAHERNVAVFQLAKASGDL